MALTAVFRAMTKWRVPTWAITSLEPAERLSPYGPGAAATLVTVHHNTTLCGVALRVGRWPLITSELPPIAAPPAADALSNVANPLPGAGGPIDTAEAFATGLDRQTGAAGAYRDERSCLIQNHSPSRPAHR